MKRFLLLFLLSILFVSCSSDSPAVEIPRRIWVKNMTGYDCAWKIRKASEPEAQNVELMENKGSFIIHPEDNEEYILDVFLIKGQKHEIQEDIMTSTRLVMDNMSISIKTDIRVNDLELNYSRDGFEIYWHKWDDDYCQDLVVKEEI